MAKAELILEYFKTILWPLVFVIVVLVFHSQISAFLEGVEEAEILGVRIKGRTSQIRELNDKQKGLEKGLNELQKKLHAQEEMNANLRTKNKELQQTIVAQNQKINEARSRGNVDLITPAKVPKASAATPDLSVSLQVAKQFSDIRNQLDITQQIVGSSKFDRAKNLEIQGFNHLVRGQFGSALQSFEEAYRVFPTYHNVDEIRKLLRRKELDLADANPSVKEKARREVYGEILKKYSWGMPSEVKVKMREFLQ